MVQVLFYILCFLGGIVSTVLAFLGFAWYLGTQERVRRAETAQKRMESIVKAVEEQKLAEERLRASLTELAKSRQVNQKVTLPTSVPQAPIDPELTLSVQDRLRKAVALTAKQSKIDITRGPEFIMQHNELELEKLVVLKTILADGFDPVITIRFNTVDQEMPLSAYVQSIGRGLA